MGLKHKKLNAKVSAKRLDTNQPIYTRLDKINTTQAQQAHYPALMKAKKGP